MPPPNWLPNELIVIYHLFDEDTGLDLVLLLVRRRKVYLDCIVAGIDSSALPYHWRSRKHDVIKGAIDKLKANRNVVKILTFDSRWPKDYEPDMSPREDDERYSDDKEDVVTPPPAEPETPAPEPVVSALAPAAADEIIDPEDLPY